ncbi:Rpn family recombination-promoting nuclease/putative transposase [Pseudanabaena sp. FACHB-1277]|jgi:predicted transposase/invertase (TIGR01784 family)|uniref:Rpn family recombination-promoting nuclease/putative transposase n=1 Tax=Pseudanabaena cinerea FACHB-1277 TaxID=2949581 RepID=A0A926UY17_9CYAN|nr:Rpn family recombination-promoting nuclease/putative transposase [Pseudanabaena cinerea]MBD2152896.1 Rpn family recombination-promoting nuclease/putative transposase [Pseudanabaena cinerea FACHB-1277]
MFYPRLSGDRYVNPFTSFGFKRLFGTESNKNILIDFLNVILPSHHQVKDLTYCSTGNTPLDLNLYCQSENGERLIVEMQKAKHNYFKYRNIYFSSFSTQEQIEKGNWNDKITPVYMIGILDFVFNENKNDDNFFYIVEHDCQEKLKFIYLELPKYNKTIDRLNDHLDKWLFLLKHLPDLKDPPIPLQENIFMQLFEIAKITNFSQTEMAAYENSLKYYRDMNCVIETAREEGIKKGKAQVIQEGMRSLLFKQLARKLGTLPDETRILLNQLSLEQLDELSEALFELGNIEDLHNLLENI